MTAITLFIELHFPWIWESIQSLKFKALEDPQKPKEI